MSPRTEITYRARRNSSTHSYSEVHTRHHNLSVLPLQKEDLVFFGKKTGWTFREKQKTDTCIEPNPLKVHPVPQTLHSLSYFTIIIIINSIHVSRVHGTRSVTSPAGSRTCVALEGPSKRAGAFIQFRSAWVLHHIPSMTRAVGDITRTPTQCVWRLHPLVSGSMTPAGVLRLPNPRTADTFQDFAHLWNSMNMLERFVVTQRHTQCHRRQKRLYRQLTRNHITFLRKFNNKTRHFDRSFVPKWPRISDWRTVRIMANCCFVERNSTVHQPDTTLPVQPGVLSNITTCFDLNTGHPVVFTQ